MPNATLEAALKEAYAQASQDVTIFDTLEIGQVRNKSLSLGGGGPGSVDNITDVVILIDVTSSMGTQLSNIKASMATFLSDADSVFTDTRFALVSFRDEGDTEVVQDFTSSSATLIAAVNGLTASGGGDGPENGFGAITLAKNDLTFRTGSRKIFYLFTDNASHERGSTYEEALSALNGVQFFLVVEEYTTSIENSYGGLVEANTASLIDGNIPSNGVIIDTDLPDLEDLQTTFDFSVKFYLVQGTEERAFTLETDAIVTFEPVAFRFQLPGQNERGISELGIAIDNVDQRIGAFVQSSLNYKSPILVVYRPYLSTDTTQPQQNPPLQLVLSDLQVDGFEVTGRATFADIVNLDFLTDYYTRARFPSLGNT